MSFNPDPSKQAQEVLFSNKTIKKIIQILYLMVTQYKIVPKNDFQIFQEKPLAYFSLFKNI